MKTLLKKTSRVEFVKTRMQALIRRQALRPGDRLPSETRIAEQLGVGPVTVHKAFRELAREGIVERHPNRRGTFLRGASARIVGVIGGGVERSFFNDPYFGNVMAGVDAVLRERGTSFLFKSVGCRAELADLFADTPVAGILAIGSSFWLRYARELKNLAEHKQLIFIGGLTSDAECNVVGSDYFNDSRIGVERLIRKGHRQIAMFGASSTMERLAGFRAAMQAARLKPDKRLIFIDPSHDNIQSAIRVIKHFRPTAIFMASGYLVSLFMPHVLGAGLKPEILAYDDFRDELRHFPVSTTVIRQPLEKIGNIAAQKLLGLIDGEIQAPVQILVKSEIVDIAARKLSVK